MSIESVNLKSITNTAFYITQKTLSQQPTKGLNEPKKPTATDILPVSLDALITSECWTFYKFAVMQTTATYKDLLMDFMKVWTDEKGISFFGSPKERTQQSYYHSCWNVDALIFNGGYQTIFDTRESEIMKV